MPHDENCVILGQQLESVDVKNELFFLQGNYRIHYSDSAVVGCYCLPFSSLTLLIGRHQKGIQVVKKPCSNDRAICKGSPGLTWSRPNFLKIGQLYNKKLS